MNNNTFAIHEDFLLNDQPFKIISGSIHYFRVVPEYWQDRLEKLKAMGCNTVEMYVPWNLHEPEEGQFCFEGICDIVAFIKRAHALNLWVIVRPGPYICAEWEWGGLPYWLLKNEGIRVRTTDPRYMAPLGRYFKELLGRLLPLQIHLGGPIILMQVENEYGSYGNDRVYTAAVRDLMLDCGVTVPLVTSDGDLHYMQKSGGIDGVHPTANFGSRASERFPFLQDYLQTAHGKKGPLMCMEFWVGWFDHWGKDHHSTTAYTQNAEDLDYMLEHGSVNFYMYHGGTNFGLMNGSNYGDQLTPDVTSYDYDAPLSEDGKITEKYKAFQEVIAKHAPIPEVPLTTTITQTAYGSFSVGRKVSLFSTLDSLTTPVENPWTLSMENLNQGYGYTLYSANVDTHQQVKSIRLLEANDRALIFLDGKKELTLYDRELLDVHSVDWTLNNDSTLDILMENMGRVNFGPYLNCQYKGIRGSVVLNNQTQSHWQHRTLPMHWEQLQNIDYSQEYIAGTPAFYEVTISVDTPADTYLDMSGWGKGLVLLNDFQLGRFWDIGPQKTLYIPAPLLKQGKNIITIFESEGTAGEGITFLNHAQLGSVK